MPGSVDPRPQARIRDGALLEALHHEWRECVLCRSVGFETNFVWIGLSLHHICKHPKDDARGNLVMLCGDGVRGCHGLIERNDRKKRKELGLYLRLERPDVLAHLEWRKGEGAREWFRQQFGLDS